MQISLKGRRALVSGSTSGIGFATALGLARAGGHVILNGRSEDRVDEAVKRLAEIVPAASVEGISADLSTAEGSNVLVRLSGDVDILINNIGVVQFADFFERLKRFPMYFSEHKEDLAERMVDALKKVFSQMK